MLNLKKGVDKFGNGSRIRRIATFYWNSLIKEWEVIWRVSTDKKQT